MFLSCPFASSSDFSVIFGPESHSSAESWQMSEISEVNFTVEDKSVDIFLLGLVVHIHYQC